jgi:molybdopterin molybdotransferase
MISYDEASRKTLAAIPQPLSESLPLAECPGRVLAEAVKANQDLPPFTRSLVDGFALRSDDLRRGWNRLRVIGSVAAGAAETVREIGPGECVRIMTGAPLPAGADAVQMFEETEQLAPLEVVIRTPVSAGAHLLPAGAEARPGSVILEPGRILGPAEIAVLAALGRPEIRTWRPPRVKVVSTGDELVPPGRNLEPGQIYDCNRPMIEARSRELGAFLDPGAQLRDDPSAIQHQMVAADSDFLVLTGGVSAGDHDYVHELLEPSGFSVIYHKVAIKPGKPVLFASRGRQRLFGLPGNPVSAAVTFELFVRPAILKWMGHSNPCLPAVKARLTAPIRQRTGRLFFRPGRFRIGADAAATVCPLRWVSSSDLIGFADSNCLIQVPADTGELVAGDEVLVSVLDRPRFGDRWDREAS